MVFDVCPYVVQRSPVLNAPVKVYHVMVTDTAVTLLAVPFINVSSSEICPAFCRGAVYHNRIKVSHNLLVFGFRIFNDKSAHNFSHALPLIDYFCTRCVGVELSAVQSRAHKSLVNLLISSSVNVGETIVFVKVGNGIEHNFIWC